MIRAESIVGFGRCTLGPAPSEEGWAGGGKRPVWRCKARFL